MNRIVGIVVAVLILAGSGYLAAEHLANARMKQNIDAEIEKYREEADVTYEDLRYSLAGSSARMTNFRVAGREEGAGEVTVDEMVVSDFKPKKDKDAFPPLLRFRANGIQLSEEVNAELSQELKELGYEQPPRMDAEVEYEYDLETKQLVIDKIALMGNEMGQLSLSLSLDNFQVPPQLTNGERPNPMQLMAVLSGIAIRSCEIIFEDNGLTNRMLERGAEAQGITREEFVTQLLGDLRENFKADSSTLNRQALTAIEGFLDEPSQLKIRANPSTPISVASIVAAQFLGGKSQIPTMLGIEVSN